MTIALQTASGYLAVRGKVLSDLMTALPGVVFHMPLQEDANPVRDTVGGQTGTANAGVTLGVAGMTINGAAKVAAQFDGSTGHIITSAALASVGGDELTVSALVYPTGWDGLSTIYNNAVVSSFRNPLDPDNWENGTGNDYYNNRGFMLSVRSTLGTLRFYRGAGSIASATALTLNTWQLITATAKSGTGRIYINSTEVKNGALATPAGASVWPLTIGEESEWFAGSIAYVAIATTEWSAAEIASLCTFLGL